MKELIKRLIPSIVLDFYHYLLALIGAFFYGFPGKRIKVIGITGTSGKSTIVDLTNRILEQAGYTTACLSSVSFKIKDKEWENKLKMTMPGRFKIQKFLKQAVKEKCDYVILEITSQGIKQFRHKFINFEIAVFTNLSPEHIEAHHGFENYMKAKLELFKDTKNIHILNLDDENVESFLKQQSKQKIGFGIDFKDQSFKTLKAENIQIKSDGISFDTQGIQFNLNLLGSFNVYNSLAAICIGLSQNVPLETAKQALEKVKGIPGRMEVVIKKPFTVIVDYAHTPEALEKVYKTLKSNPLICVLGSCGGGRDKWKRPVLGKIASKYCKEIIVTNEDPYNENPVKIINQVSQGINAKKILDRRQAIRQALKMANPNDIVIITGKGSEPWICVRGGKKEKWDDRQIVREEFKKLDF